MVKPFRGVQIRALNKSRPSSGDPPKQKRLRTGTNSEENADPTTRGFGSARTEKVYSMTTQSLTAVPRNSFPAWAVLAATVLLATLFVVLQTLNAPLFSHFQGQSSVSAPSISAPVAAQPAAPVAGGHNLIDRWEPYIKEAAIRYAIPETWIRTIIHIESGGRTTVAGRPITSGAGAMGVMQLMRGTYHELSVHNGLGSDPYNVHDNILAGSAYLRELYNRYGYPRMFAAYNAGPAKFEKAMAHHTALPLETQNYVRMAVAGTSGVLPA